MERPLRMSRRAVINSLALAAVLPRIAAQPSDEWRKKHTFPNRYEGLINIPTGDVDFEVLSFTSFTGSLDGAVDLSVRFFSPEQATLVVYGHELEIVRQYWMESRPVVATPMSWNNFGPWPMKDVLIPEEVDISNLGITVRPQRASSFEFLPPIVVTSAGKPPNEILRYQLYLRSKYNLRGLSYTLTNLDQPSAKPVQETLKVPRVAGIPFPLGLMVPSFPDGHAQLLVQGNSSRGSMNPYTINFYHRRRT